MIFYCDAKALFWATVWIIEFFSTMPFEQSWSCKCHIYNAFFFHELMHNMYLNCTSEQSFFLSYSLYWNNFFPSWTDALSLFTSFCFFFFTNFKFKRFLSIMNWCQVSFNANLLGTAIFTKLTFEWFSSFMNPCNMYTLVHCRIHLHLLSASITFNTTMMKKWGR